MRRSLGLFFFSIYAVFYPSAPAFSFSIPKPLPLYYEIPLSVIASALPLSPSRNDTPPTLHYQLAVYDKEGKQDRTGVGEILLKL